MQPPAADSQVGSKLTALSSAPAHVRSYVSLPRPSQPAGKPDLQGMRASFFGTTSSTSRLRPATAIPGANSNKQLSSNVASMAASIRPQNGVTHNTLESTKLTDLNDKVTDNTQSSATNEDKSVASKSSEGPSLDTLAMIAGLGSLASGRQTSFRRLPPPSNVTSSETSTTDKSKIETKGSEEMSGSGETASAQKRRWTSKIKSRTGINF